MNREKILLIEDDPQIREMIADQVNLLGYELCAVQDGAAGLELAIAETFALVLLDVNLPSLGGLELCRRLKAEKPILPIIMVSARGEELDKVLGLQIGADDYLVKPFSVNELAARIQARLRTRDLSASKGREYAPQGAANFGPFEVNIEKRIVKKHGTDVILTALEFDLFVLLLSNPGVAFSRAELLEKLWGVQTGVYENSPTPIVTRLRKKLEDNPSTPELILTVWSVGYKFSDAVPVKWQ